MLKTGAAMLAAQPNPRDHNAVGVPRTGTPGGSRRFARLHNGSGEPDLVMGSARAPLSPVNRLERSEARLLAVAITCSIALCAVLVLYLGAYAKVTSLGLSQAHGRVELRAQRFRNETLRAQCAALQNPNRIGAKAKAMGMVVETRHVCYIDPNISLQAVPVKVDTQLPQVAVIPTEQNLTGFQVANRGTTADGDTTTFSHH